MRFGRVYKIDSLNLKLGGQYIWHQKSFVLLCWFCWPLYSIHRHWVFFVFCVTGHQMAAWDNVLGRVLHFCFSLCFSRNEEYFFLNGLWLVGSFMSLVCIMQSKTVELWFWAEREIFHSLYAQCVLVNASTNNYEILQQLFFWYVIPVHFYIYTEMSAWTLEIRVSNREMDSSALWHKFCVIFSLLTSTQRDLKQIPWKW